MSMNAVYSILTDYFNRANHFFTFGLNFIVTLQKMQYNFQKKLDKRSLI